MFLRLKSRHLNQLVEEARRVHPVEACAMLFGELSAMEAVVKKIMVAPNKLQSSVRFEIPPEIVVKAVIEAEKEGLAFIGIFHSHPASAAPSSVDLKFMKLWGEVVWLILSLTDNKFAAYQMKDGGLIETRLKIE